jgi:hypothetical protein
MNKKTKKAQRKKIIEQIPPPYTEGHWEEAMLEENSYWDVDVIIKANAPVYKKIDKWTKKYDKVSSWLGKWYCQIQIDKLRKKLVQYESKP